MGTVAVHYTDAWSAYGPIVAADEGISWFTLRNTWDSGARYMPAAREQLRAARVQNFQHREATASPMPVASAEQLARTDRAVLVATVIEQTPDGMATWRYRLPPGASMTRTRSARRRRTVLDRAVRVRLGGRCGVFAAEFLCFCRARRWGADSDGG